MKLNCHAGLTKPQPTPQGGVPSPAEAARTSYPHLAQSPGAGCPGEGLASGEVGFCSEADPDGADSWRSPADRTPCSWAVKPSLKEGRAQADHSPVLPRTLQTRAASQRGLDGLPNSSATLHSDQDPPHSKWDVWTRSPDTTWEIVRNADSVLGPMVHLRSMLYPRGWMTPGTKSSSCLFS